MIRARTVEQHSADLHAVRAEKQARVRNARRPAQQTDVRLPQ
jgi:hypothetical protein